MRPMRLAATVMIVLVIAAVLALEQQAGGATERVVNQVDSALQVAKQAMEQAQNATQHTK